MEGTENTVIKIAKQFINRSLSYKYSNIQILEGIDFSFRFSSVIKTRGIRRSFEKKQKLREDLKRVKEISKAIRDQKVAEKEAKKQRRIENLKRAEENRKKGEVVQVVSRIH